MKPMCGNCKYGGEEVSPVGWRRCYVSLGHAPIGNDVHTHRDDVPCPAWAAKEPTEYRPGDGPFWAARCNWNPHWVVCFGKDYEITHLATEPARMTVDALNRACREWAGEHALAAAQEAAGRELQRLVNETWRRETEAALESARRSGLTKKRDD